MSHKNFPRPEGGIRIENYNLGRDFHSVAELLHNEGMFNSERDRYDQISQLHPYIPMKVARAMGEKTVGSVYINGGIGLVEGLVVHPDFRGRGIGALLLDAAEAYLQRQGHRYIEVQIDDDRDDLEEWYKRRGFISNYRVVGMMREIGPAQPTLDTSEITLDRHTVSQAFMNLYMHYRYREGYFEPSGIKREELTNKELDDISARYPRISSQELLDVLKQGGYSKPPLTGDRYLNISWESADDILKHASIPMLRGACFSGEAWGIGQVTPWVVFSAVSKQEVEHVQAWLGRASELSKPITRRPEATGPYLEDVFYTFPNDAFLFLRRVEGIRRFGRPPSLDKHRPDGEYVCHDQANKNTFAFRIKDDDTELLDPEETALILEDMVRYVKTYEAMAEGRRIKLPEDEIE